MDNLTKNELRVYNAIKAAALYETGGEWCLGENVHEYTTLNKKDLAQAMGSLWKKKYIAITEADEGTSAEYSSQIEIIRELGGKRLRCPACRYIWTPRKEHQAKCPQCQKRFWKVKPEVVE